MIEHSNLHKGLVHLRQGLDNVARVSGWMSRRDAVLGLLEHEAKIEVQVHATQGLAGQVSQD